MTIQERLYTFTELGKDLQQLSDETRLALFRQAKAGNLWFTADNVQLAIDTISHYLHPEALKNWLASYSLPAGNTKRVGVVMAGHTPAEGFHDCMCVLLSGHVLVAKLNPQDSVLLKKIAQLLIEINPAFEDKIIFADRLTSIDALIATVNDRAVGQFNRYFSQMPHIIRSQKKSCGIIRGDETATDLQELGNDILHYFGLGNRNVSKLYVPEGYSFHSFYQSIEPWHRIMEYHKYVNNYDYNKSILLVNQQAHHDNGFLLLHENDRLISPVAVVHYIPYKHTDELSQQLAIHQHQLQSVVSGNGWYPGSISFGQTLKPALADYIGGVDTMQFLSSF